MEACPASKEILLEISQARLVFQPNKFLLCIVHATVCFGLARIRACCGTMGRTSKPLRLALAVTTLVLTTSPVLQTVRSGFVPSHGQRPASSGTSTGNQSI